MNLLEFREDMLVDEISGRNVRKHATHSFDDRDACADGMTRRSHHDRCFAGRPGLYHSGCVDSGDFLVVGPERHAIGKVLALAIGQQCLDAEALRARTIENNQARRDFQSRHAAVAR